MAAKKTTKKPAVTKVANALSETIGRIGAKVNQISGSARDTISKQIDTALDRKEAALMKEYEEAMAKVDESAKSYKAMGGEEGGRVYSNEAFIERHDRLKSNEYSLKQEVAILKDARQKWNSFKKGAGSEKKKK